MRASEAGHTEVVELLLERGALFDKRCAKGRTPLCEASFQGHQEVVKALLK